MDSNIKGVLICLIFYLILIAITGLINTCMKIRTGFYTYGLRADNDTNFFYIGKSFVGSYRLMEHLSEARRGEKDLKSNKIRKLLRSGNAIIEEVLLVTDNEQEALNYEVALIAKYGRRNNKTGILTNLTDGGEGTVGVIYSAEVREKMSKAKMGNKINVGRKRPDMIEKFSKIVSYYDLAGNLIKTYSSAREASKDTGIPFGQISNCCLGTILKTRDTNKEIYRFSFGEALTIEPYHFTTAKSKKIGQFDMDGNVIAEFENSRIAMKATGINEVSIRNVALEKQKKAGGFVWKYI